MKVSRKEHDLTIEMIDGLITQSRVLSERLKDHSKRMKKTELDWFPDDVSIALADLAGNNYVTGLLFPRDEKSMKIIHDAADLLRNNSDLNS